MSFQIIMEIRLTMSTFNYIQTSMKYFCHGSVPYFMDKTALSQGKVQLFCLWLSIETEGQYVVGIGASTLLNTERGSVLLQIWRSLF